MAFTNYRQVLNKCLILSSTTLLIVFHSIAFNLIYYSPPPEDGFIPETYIIGPEEDLPRKLDCMEFVMHAPSDYYKLKNTPYPPSLTETGAGYIWTSLRSEINNSNKKGKD